MNRKDFLDFDLYTYMRSKWYLRVLLSMFKVFNRVGQLAVAFVALIYFAGLGLVGFDRFIVVAVIIFWGVYPTLNYLLHMRVNAIDGLDKGVRAIVDLIPDKRRKALVWCAFDSGFRRMELLNVKIADLELVDDVYYITCRVSKTKPRTVSLPLSTELLRDWLDEHPFKDNFDATVFQTTKRSFERCMGIYSLKALKKHCTIHMLRHTSATYYATRLERTSFCKRFGWSYSSKSPDRYIDYAKVEEKKVVEVVKNEKYGEIKTAYDDLKAENQSVKDTLFEMQKRLSLMEKAYEAYEWLKKNKGV